MQVKLNKRTLDENYIIGPEKELVHYNKLKEKLIINFKDEIYNKIETMKILKEIKDKGYYKLDGYKNFIDFVLNFNLAKTQVYNYLKIATAMEEGLINDDFVLKNGFNQTLSFIKDKESVTIKKSRQNPIKPLRFQLKSQESYDFYKNNPKLTGFILDTLFLKDKDLLKHFIDKFHDLKTDKLS
ncbi:chromosome replication/partitioning protein (plasmid) [Borrelia miyamotoi]|uniref:Chromosome replication/partitioning protein n=1 Tax=Borrelia miyamotoi TaxID=47466 RepID=A0A5P8AUV5_9SPIR|nr:chromosome replication/partitioning protein [Borrelia miyamotoi]QFP42543.1 chromosome replication/partitioning protein [Borrelia miyamotoi]WAZ72276.1 chromosome replication/partitioning protein [Borrelia miyamotoi]WVI05271.1 chromosome replication/partitioning protein [Borrelia miyamotoi]